MWKIQKIVISAEKIVFYSRKNVNMKFFSFVWMHNAIKLGDIDIRNFSYDHPMFQLPHTTLFIKQTVSVHQHFIIQPMFSLFYSFIFRLLKMWIFVCFAAVSYTFVQITFTPLFIATLHRKITETHFVKFLVGNLGFPWFMRFCICVRSLCKWNRFQFAYRTQSPFPLITVILKMDFFRVFRL